MVMDRSEQIGLGFTLGGHAAIIAAIFFLNGPEEEIIKEPGMAVTLVGEGTAAPVTGEIGETPPPPADDLVEEVSDEADIAAKVAAEVADSKADEAAAAEAAAKKAQAAAASANATAAQKKAAREAAAKAAKKKREAAAAEAKRKKAARDKARKEKAAKDKAARDKAAKDKARREFEEAMKGKTSSNASATAGQARGKASGAIGDEVRPFIKRNCKLSSGDGSSLQVFVALTISKKGALQSASVDNVKGTTPQNRTQVEPAKRCVIQSLRQASPYNLNPADYNVWKNHRVQIKVNIK